MATDKIKKVTIKVKEVKALTKDSKELINATNDVFAEVK